MKRAYTFAAVMTACLLLGGTANAELTNSLTHAQAAAVRKVGEAARLPDIVDTLKRQVNALPKTASVAQQETVIAIIVDAYTQRYPGAVYTIAQNAAATFPKATVTIATAAANGLWGCGGATPMTKLRIARCVTQGASLHDPSELRGILQVSTGAVLGSDLFLLDLQGREEKPPLRAEPAPIAP